MMKLKGAFKEKIVKIFRNEDKKTSARNIMFKE